MAMIQNIKGKYYRTRSSWYRLQRMWFPSEAEVKFVEIMGGRFVRVQFIRHPKTDQPLTYIFSLGRVLGEQQFDREVRVGKYYVDFGNDIRWAIEVDGREWHRDVVREFDRDLYIREHGWRVKHIDAVRLWNEPANVQIETLKFLNA